MTTTKRARIVLFVALLCVGAYLAIDIRLPSPYIPPTDVEDPNPIPQVDTVELEKMTWMEVRDRISSGYTRVIIPTGGIEQNGPFVALNKHDLIVKEVSVRVARNIGNTIVAPVVSFVPEGGIEPKTGHMRYPGTISLSETTFEDLLRDITLSLSAHGFREILVVGDSGDSQRSLKRVAERLDQKLRGSGTLVRYIPEFYDYARVREILQDHAITETPERFHEELAFSLQLMAIDPSAIRYEERMRAGRDTLGGLSLHNRDQMKMLGEEILQKRVESISAAIRR